MLEKNGLFVVRKGYIGGPFSRFLLSFMHIFPQKIFRIFCIPLTIMFQKIDHVFFKNNEKNFCVAIIAEKEI